MSCPCCHGSTYFERNLASRGGYVASGYCGTCLERGFVAYWVGEALRRLA